MRTNGGASRRQIRSVLIDCLDRQSARRETHLTRSSMRNHMDCIELPFSPLNRSRHLSRGGFIVGEQDRLDIGADAGEQRCEVIDAAVDEGDLALGANGH